MKVGIVFSMCKVYLLLFICFYLTNSWAISLGSIYDFIKDEEYVDRFEENYDLC